jgi:lipid-A-disaccharide synthase
VPRAAPLVFLVAGEPSGDVLGGRLMAALRRSSGGAIRFAGIGGEAMTREGLTSLFAMDDLAIMGFAEVLPRLPRLLRRLDQTARAVAELRPDIVVTIDAPGFNLRLARRLRPLGVPLVHYVAPQLWAWRPERARRLAGLFDSILALFPFETEFFATLGIETVLVGHPAIEAGPPVLGDFRMRLGIAAPAPVLAMLPGSRAGLARRMLPIYARTAAALAGHVPNLVVVVPVVPATRPLVEAALRNWAVPARVISDPEDRQRVAALADAAVTTSGTATLELALAGLPMVVAYRTNPVSAILARRLIRVPHVALPNLVLGRAVVPECLQERCTAETLAAAAAPLLIREGAASAAQRASFAELRAALGGKDGPPPSERAAAAVMAAIRR